MDLEELAADHFLIWEPRDIVGGDFFWFQPIQDGYAVMVGDCTGHGVPGAFMTLIAWGLLDRMLRSAPSDKPSEVLVGIDEGLKGDCAVNLDHVQTVEKRRLHRFVGTLEGRKMGAVCRALAIAAGCAA